MQRPVFLKILGCGCWKKERTFQVGSGSVYDWFSTAGGWKRGFPVGISFKRKNGVHNAWCIQSKELQEYGMKRFLCCSTPPPPTQNHLDRRPPRGGG